MFTTAPLVVILGSTKSGSFAKSEKNDSNAIHAHVSAIYILKQEASSAFS